LKIVLLSIHTCPSPQAVPLANAFLQCFLRHTLPKDNQPDIQIRELYLGDDAVSSAAQLAQTRPDAIGFSVYTWNRQLCNQIAVELRKAMPAVKLFCGGPEVTADPAGIMKDAPYDFVVIGEGEVPFSAACQAMQVGQPLEGIPGLAISGEETVVRGPSKPLDDLAAIPSPWLDGTLNTADYKGILWQLSRGCGFACDFCFDSRGTRGVRRFPQERLEAELKLFARSGVEQIFVLDSTFNQDAQRAKTILKMIARIASHIHFHFEVRSEFIDSQMSNLFAQIPCSLQIGLQSADPQVLKSVNRIFNPADFRKKISLLNSSGAVFGFDLMYGLPGDTLQGFAASLDFALSLYPNHLDIFPLAVLPGTALAKRSDAIGLLHLPAPPYTLISAPGFSEDDMRKARQLANACDIFYTRGKAVAWFNAVVKALGLKPSQFLERFGQWLKENQPHVVSESDLDDHSIWQMQRSFLKEAFAAGKFRRMLPLALDLADYHYHYAAALFASQPAKPKMSKTGQLHKCSAKLSPSAQLAVFNYEILDILEAAGPDLRSFCGSVSKSGSWALIYKGPDGGIYTESIIEPYYRLLKMLDGRTPCGEIVKKAGMSWDDAREFVEFAVAEGIISIS